MCKRGNLCANSQINVQTIINVQSRPIPFGFATKVDFSFDFRSRYRTLGAEVILGAKPSHSALHIN